MYKLLIVDDEPLVQIGLQSMLPWQELGITLCGSAGNGKQALDMIRQSRPDIVITDIKMPIMNGLELLEACRSSLKNPPEFIILTCYEDFPYVKKALENQATGYIIKLGLNPQELSSAVERALNRIRVRQDKDSPDQVSSDQTFMNSYRDKFFMRLLHNLFEDDEQFALQARQLGLTFHPNDRFAAAICTVDSGAAFPAGSRQYIALYRNTLSMLTNILTKYMPVHLASLDMNRFCITFRLTEASPYGEPKAFSDMLRDAFQMLYNYFRASVCCGAGSWKDNVRHLSDSYQEARQALLLCSEENPVVLYGSQLTEAFAGHGTFNITVMRDDLQKAFEEYDMTAFQHIIDSITALFRGQPAAYTQAMDVTSNILHLCLTMLPDSEKFLAEAFARYPDTYRCLYSQNTTEQIMDWLDLFRQSVLEFCGSRHKELKNTLILNIMQYIEEHINEKLVLNDAAAIFSISPNYLGHLFKKGTGMGFNEYVTQAKISKAKYLMFHTDMKVYEIASQLGFENSFYFSRVFKKVEGCSPRQYAQNLLSGETPSSE